jgi:parallel beta-helix repeat protein
MLSDRIVRGVPMETILNFTSDKAIVINAVNNTEISGLKITGAGCYNIAGSTNMHDHRLFNTVFSGITSTKDGTILINITGGGHYVKNVWIDNVLVDTTVNHGYDQVLGSSTAYVDGLSMTNSRFTSCGDGTHDYTCGLNILQQGQLYNALIDNVVTSYSWESGFYFETGRTISNVKINNCASIYNGQKPSPSFGAGFLLDNNTSISNCYAAYNNREGITALGDRNIIVGNKCALNGRAGIRLNGSYNNILSSNICYGNGQQTTAQYGIQFDKDYNNVHGNRCYDDGSGKQLYGLYYNGANWCLIQGNILQGNATSATAGALGVNSVETDEL